MSNTLDSIEATLADIERLDAETGGQFRDEDDAEALKIVRRIERKMHRKLRQKGVLL